MSLDKKRQVYLLAWLKSHAKWHRRDLKNSVLTGFIYAVVIIIQAGLFAEILHQLIIEQVAFLQVLVPVTLLILTFIIRALLVYFREKINFAIGYKIRQTIRAQIINRLEQLGPAYLNHQTTGAWSSLLIEQIDNLQNFYARYLPQMRLASMVPILIFIAILPFNWAAALILLFTAPLIPLFMVLVGMGAADVNRRNFRALSYLSGHFLDRLKGLATIRLFYQGAKQTDEIYQASENFRIRTMQVLKMAFLSSAVLEFFTSISIAVVAVYFGFSYLGEFHFGNYNGTTTLFAGFFALILAPEFFQPLRDLGAYYHDKAEAIAAADNIESFLTQYKQPVLPCDSLLLTDKINTIVAKDLVVLSTELTPLVGPLSFSLKAPFNVALIGTSGEGKSSIFNALMGFLPYQGSLKINDIELKQLDINTWQTQLSWIGQNPYLLSASIRENILLGNPSASNEDLYNAAKHAQLLDVIETLPHGFDTQVGEEAVRLSAGQAQRVAIARAMLKPCQLLLLDEPAASLDKQTAHNLLQHINAENTITITHQIGTYTAKFDAIWQLDHGKIIVKEPI